MCKPCHKTDCVSFRFIRPASLNNHCGWHVRWCGVSWKLLCLFGDGQLPSSFLDDLFAIGSRNVLLYQPIADRPTSPERSLGTLELESLAVHAGAADSRRFGPADEFVGTDLAPLGKESVFDRSLQGLEQMAEKRFTDVEVKRGLAGGDAGVLDVIDSSGAVKIGEGVPL